MPLVRRASDVAVSIGRDQGRRQAAAFCGRAADGHAVGAGGLVFHVGDGRLGRAFEDGRAAQRVGRRRHRPHDLAHVALVIGNRQRRGGRAADVGPDVRIRQRAGAASHFLPLVRRASDVAVSIGRDQGRRQAAAFCGRAADGHAVGAGGFVIDTIRFRFRATTTSSSTHQGQTQPQPRPQQASPIRRIITSCSPGFGGVALGLVTRWRLRKLAQALCRCLQLCGGRQIQVRQPLRLVHKAINFKCAIKLRHLDHQALRAFFDHNTFRGLPFGLVDQTQLHVRHPLE